MLFPVIPSSERVFPRGYQLGAIGVFFIGVALLLWGVAVLVTTALFPPSFTRVIPNAIFGGIAVIGIGSVLASWALLGGRLSEEGAQQ